MDANKSTGKKNEDLQWAQGRRWSVMGDFVSKVGKLAAMRNMAILLINQTTTKVKTESGAVLRPALSSKSWDNGINIRIALFRDWLQFGTKNQSEQEQEQVKDMRFACVLKVGSVTCQTLGRFVPFQIHEHCLQQVQTTTENNEKTTVLPILSSPAFKRKRAEIGDSQSEDEGLGSGEEFGWADEEEIATGIH